MLFDTHCHLDATEYDPDRECVIARAQDAGVRGILIPAVDVASFERVRDLAHAHAWGAYALGIHPMYVEQAQPDALDQLHAVLIRHRDDPKLVAIGEIGLDFFVPAIAQGAPRDRQERFYDAQLAMAEEFALPVLLHVRRSHDTLLKYLRRRQVPGGFAHAFNGSSQQASQFIALGFALGMGGAMTYTRALQIRRLAQEISLDSLVLETDGPDIAPAWLTDTRRNEPMQVARFAQVLAALRQCPVEEIIAATGNTALRVCPRLIGAWGLGTL